MIETTEMWNGTVTIAEERLGSPAQNAMLINSRDLTLEETESP